MTETRDQRLEKGQQTRERMLEEGVRLFAQKGYEGVSVRELAQASGVNPAAVSFHFGGKPGFYEAVIEHMAATLAAMYSQTLAVAMDLPEDAGPEQAADAARTMLENLVRAVLTTPRSLWTTLLIQRELISPSPAFDRLYGQAIEPALKAYASVIARVSALPPDGDDARTLAFGLFAMVNAYSRSRRTYLRWAGKTDFTQEDVEAVARTVSGLASRGLPGLTGGRAKEPS